VKLKDKYGVIDRSGKVPFLEYSETSNRVEYGPVPTIISQKKPKVWID
jgi:hypothetical protein